MALRTVFMPKTINYMAETLKRLKSPQKMVYDIARRMK